MKATFSFAFTVLGKIYVLLIDGESLDLNSGVSREINTDKRSDQTDIDIGVATGGAAPFDAYKEFTARSFISFGALDLLIISTQFCHTY